jgi:hypothetical protein
MSEVSQTGTSPAALTHQSPPAQSTVGVTSLPFEERFRAAQNAAQESIERAGSRADKDRTKIAVTIMFVFAGSVTAGLLLLVARGFANPYKWPEVTKDAADLIKTAVLPIVTLMLGYYFGTSGK